MARVKYSKQPWRLGRYSRTCEDPREVAGCMDICVENELGTYIIASCNHNFPEDAKANAALMVLAPRLLAALDKCLVVLSGDGLTKQQLNDALEYSRDVLKELEVPE